MAGKGPADRSSAPKRGKAKMWCECGYARWACRCMSAADKDAIDDLARMTLDRTRTKTKTK